jgi:hypothetical protein
VGLKNNDGITASYTTSANGSSPVATYSIVAAAVDSSPAKLSNYDVTLVNGTLNIAPKGLTITADDKNMELGDAALPAFTVTPNGFVNGDTLASLGGQLTFATSVGATSPIGSYTVTPGGLTSPNYTITFVAGHVHVIYRWDGFLQPINDTAHQIGMNTSIFKAGSTVPAKFVLKRHDGTIVQATNLPLWITPVRGGQTTDPVDETQYTDQANTGATYRWDSTGQQYIYNWGSPKSGAGYYWRIGVTLDDGMTYFVNIGLR